MHRYYQSLETHNYQRVFVLAMFQIQFKLLLIVTWDGDELFGDFVAQCDALLPKEAGLIFGSGDGAGGIFDADEGFDILLESVWKMI